MKKFQKIVSLLIALLLAVLSVHLTYAETFESFKPLSTAQKQLNPVTIGHGMPYVIDAEQPEISMETEQEPLPLTCKDRSVFNGLNNGHNSFWWVPSTNIQLATSALGLHKQHTKRLLFPFHSHW